MTVHNFVGHLDYQLTLSYNLQAFIIKEVCNRAVTYQPAAALASKSRKTIYPDIRKKWFPLIPISLALFLDLCKYHITFRESLSLIACATNLHSFQLQQFLVAQFACQRLHHTNSGYSAVIKSACNLIRRRNLAIKVLTHSGSLTFCIRVTQASDERLRLAEIRGNKAKHISQ